MSRERLEESARQLQVPIEISSDSTSADAVIALKTYSQRQSERMRSLSGAAQADLHAAGNTVAHMQQALARIFDLEASQAAPDDRTHPTTQALQEAEDAIHRMLNYGIGQAELAPQNARVRGCSIRWRRATTWSRAASAANRDAVCVSTRGSSAR